MEDINVTSDAIQIDGTNEANILISSPSEYGTNNTEVPKEVVNFDPTVIKTKYSSSEWELKCEWYLNRVNSLYLQLDSNPGSVAAVIDELQYLLSIARCDATYINVSANHWSETFANTEKRLYNELDRYGYGNANAKMTIDEKKGYIAAYMSSVPYYTVLEDGTKKIISSNMSLLDLKIGSKSRAIFIDGIIKALEDKKNFIINALSLLKTENEINKLPSKNA